jgi:hypothetical protein
MAIFFETTTTGFTNAEIERFTKGIRAALGRVKDDKVRKSLTLRAAALVAFSAQGLAPISSKPHYRTVGGSRGQRRRRNSQLQTRIKYLPGNLRNSIQALTVLRRSKYTYIGPLIDFGVRRKVYGATPQTADGYYAAPLYGSAAKFRREVLERALASQAPMIESFLLKEIKRLVDQGGRQAGFIR